MPRGHRALHHCLPLWPLLGSASFTSYLCSFTGPLLPLKTNTQYPLSLNQGPPKFVSRGCRLQMGLGFFPGTWHLNWVQMSFLPIDFPLMICLEPRASGEGKKKKSPQTFQVVTGQNLAGGPPSLPFTYGKPGRGSSPAHSHSQSARPKEGVRLCSEGTS